MSFKERPGKAVWIVAAAVIIAAFLLILLFVTQSASVSNESIVLPVAPGETGERPVQSDSANNNDHFIAVTNENVASVLQTLKRPAAYRQSYDVIVGNENRQRTKNVDLWVKGALLHAEVTDGQLRQTLITDGKEVFLWYDDGGRSVSLELPQGVTAEDLLGLPDFNAYLKISSEDLITSDYRFLEEPQAHCIYVSTEDETQTVCQYWVNLDNGLLYQSDTRENDKTVYSVVQTGFELLAEEDEAFANRFTLPDGTSPFTAGTELPQQ